MLWDLRGRLFWSFICCGGASDSEKSILSVPSRLSRRSRSARLNLRHFYPQNRHTPHGGSEKPTQRKVPAGQGLGWARAVTVATDRSMCALHRPQGPPRATSLSSPPPPSLSPPDPIPSVRPTGRWRGTRGLLACLEPERRSPRPERAAWPAMCRFSSHGYRSEQRQIPQQL